jgi:hypothetical protein
MQHDELRGGSVTLGLLQEEAAVTLGLLQEEAAL